MSQFGKQLTLRMSNNGDWKEYYLDYKGLKNVSPVSYTHLTLPTKA